MDARVKFLPYKKAREIVRKMGFENRIQWWAYCKSDKRRLDIPTDPYVVYKSKGWKYWGDWLNTKCVGPNNKKYVVNEDFFKKWSPNMAYIFGFWFADGNIRRNGGSAVFNIAQNENDKYLLELILKEMKSDYPLQYTGRDHCYNFKINSKIIYDDIIKLGGKEKKSLDCKFPHVPKKYLSDFVRGLWDGDGCITYNKRQRLYNSNYISGSKEFIEQFFMVLKQNIFKKNGTCLGGSLTLQKRSGAYRLLFGGDDTIRLKKFMYRGSMIGKLMLKRKYDLFLKTPDVCSRDFLDYTNSKNFVQSLGIKSRKEWRRYCEAGKRPQNIPCQPHVIYNNNGWIGYDKWLGFKSNKKFCNKKSKNIIGAKLNVN